MSQTFYKKGFLALAVAAALGVSAFAQADIKIGVAGPMTGANAAFGEQYMKVHRRQPMRSTQRAA